MESRGVAAGVAEFEEVYARFWPRVANGEEVLAVKSDGHAWVSSNGVDWTAIAWNGPKDVGGMVVLPSIRRQCRTDGAPFAVPRRRRPSRPSAPPPRAAPPPVGLRPRPAPPPAAPPPRRP